MLPDFARFLRESQVFEGILEVSGEEQQEGKQGAQRGKRKMRCTPPSVTKANRMDIHPSNQANPNQTNQIHQTPSNPSNPIHQCPINSAIHQSSQSTNLTIQQSINPAINPSIDPSINPSEPDSGWVFRAAWFPWAIQGKQRNRCLADFGNQCFTKTRLHRSSKVPNEPHQ